MSKIVVGVDLSAESERAVAHAVDLARHVGSELVLVLIDDVAALTGRPPGAAGSVEVATAPLDAHRRALAALRERWIAHGVEVSQLVAGGHAEELLPAVAAELGADLIVVGSHGRTGVKRFLIGSVAERVTRLADRSVLVARGDAPDGGYRRAVIGIDFSALAENAVRRAVPLMARGGHLELVHCWEMPVVGGFAEPTLLMPQAELVRGIEAGMAETVERVQGMLCDRPDLGLVHALWPASPAHGLVEAAASHAADLVVVGSHGRRGVRRLVLGSVAEVTVRHAPCSVLVAR